MSDQRASSEDSSGAAGAKLLNRRQALGVGGAAFATAALVGFGGEAAAAGKHHQPKKNAKGATLHYAEAGAFASLNPWYQGPIEEDIADQIYSRLLYLNGAGKPVPDLAESWKIARGLKSIELKLRPNLTWHSGAPVTASNFVRMFKYLTDPKLKTDLGVIKMTGLFAPVKAVHAPNRHTVRMEFSQPLPDIFTMLSYWYLVDFDNPNDTVFLKHLPNGTGPYKATGFSESTGVTLTAFPNYYKGAPAISKLYWDTFASGSSLTSDLRSGEIQGALISNYAALKPLLKSSKFRATSARTGMWELMVNVSKPPFDKLAVRQALSYSLDRKQIASSAFFGFERPTCTPFYSPSATGYVESLIDAYPFSLSKARSLLQSAGVSDLKIDFPYPSAFPTIEALAEIWQADLQQLGVTLQISPLASPAWEAMITNPATDVLIWNNGRCALDGAIFWSTQGNMLAGNKYSFGYSEPTQAKLIAKGALERNPKKRKAIYQQLNRQVVHSMHSIPIVSYSNVWAWSSKVHGQSADVIGNLQLGGVHLA